MSQLMHQRSGKHSVLRTVLLFATFSCAASVQAIDVYFTGKLVAPPPCVINGNTDVAVNFGDDLLAGRIDGTNYEQPINFTLDCSTAQSLGHNTVKLQFQGTGAGFNNGLLTTSKTDLVIRILYNGSFFPLNSSVSVNYLAMPTLSAVPVKAPGSTLSGGSFTAAATLLIGYN